MLRLARHPATRLRRGFKRNQVNPLEGDVFVIDEASMVDLMLAHQFVLAVPLHAALIIVGDVDRSTRVRLVSMPWW